MEEFKFTDGQIFEHSNLLDEKPEAKPTFATPEIAKMAEEIINLNIRSKDLIAQIEGDSSNSNLLLELEEVDAKRKSIIEEYIDRLADL